MNKPNSITPQDVKDILNRPGDWSGINQQLTECQQLLVELYQNARGIKWKADIVDTVEKYITKHKLIK